MKKIYTCTPVSFAANEGFHIRDTGLIAAGLRALGHESKCILPLPAHEDDWDLPLIRTEYKNLSSPSWWKSLGIDGLILYSWAAPRYLTIARAIKKAGIPLLIHLDSSADFAEEPFSFTPGGLRRELTHALRSLHLSYADIISIAEPAADVLARSRRYHWSTAGKFFTMSNPVTPRCAYDGRKKEHKIIAIGRWADERQKRPEFLMQTLQALYTTGCDFTTEIYGRITDPMTEWHRSLPAGIAEKISLCGYIPNGQLVEHVYNNAEILLCPSLFEGSHIVSTEALCCGCSVVTPNRPSDLRDVIWYTSRNSGSVAPEDSPESLAAALAQECRLWAEGQRNPHEIARAWQPHFHTDKVIPQIIKRFETLKK